jgi:hypothetical protein
LAETNDKIRALREVGRKDFLLQILRTEFGFSLRHDASYHVIIEEIVSRGLEGKFCQRVFRAKNFDESVSSLRLTHFLRSVYQEDLKELANLLSEGEKKWGFRKSSNRDIADAILSNCTHEQILAGLSHIIVTKNLEPVQQYRNWIYGPMGITESKEKRSELDESYASFVSKYTTKANCREIAARLGYTMPEQRDEVDLRYATVQLVLTNLRNDEILKFFNKLLDTGVLRVEVREDYWDFHATPTGIFEDRYDDPIESLANLLVSHVKEDVLRKEFRLAQGDLKKQMMGICMKQSPDETLESLFGMPELRLIAKDLGLVRVDELGDRKTLMEGILLKLGFEVPKQPTGLVSARRIIQTNLRNLSSTDNKTGFVTEAYVQLERILKDLIFFFVSVFWQEGVYDYTGEVLRESESEARLKALVDFISDRFDTKKHVNKLTLGELIALLFKIDDKADRSLVTKVFGRQAILTESQRRLLGQINSKRPTFTHHVATAPSREAHAEALTDILRLLEDLDSTGVYPKLVLMTQEATNQYGVTLGTAIDEDGSHWIIKSSDCAPAHQYLLLSDTHGLAIEPIIVRRLWEPGN